MAASIFYFIVGFRFFGSYFFHSVFTHKYVTHEQYEMIPFWRKFFHLCTWLSQGASYLDPNSYRKLHLAHHDHSDTENDPHSPLNFSLWQWGPRAKKLKDEEALKEKQISESEKVVSEIIYSPVAVSKMMWKTKEIFVEIRDGVHRLSDCYKKGELPKWPEMQQLMNSKVSMIVFVILEVAFYAFCVPAPWAWVFFPLTLINGPVQGAIVNYLGHILGYRNYKLKDNSRNTPGLAYVIPELYQNNHHSNPKNPNFANKWFEIDWTFQVMRIFAFFRMIKFKLKY